MGPEDLSNQKNTHYFFKPHFRKLQDLGPFPHSRLRHFQCPKHTLILYYFLSLIHHPTQELNLNLMFIAEKPKLSELSPPLQWCFKSDWNILIGQKLKEKREK